MILSIILLILGFILLIKGADYLVDGASALAVKASVSQIVIGLTIVAFGTSTPELIVNIVASVNNQADMAFGNVIGSNMVNILFILGISGLLKEIQTVRNTVWREIPFSFLAVLVLLVICNDTFFAAGASLLSRGDGIILLLFFVIFLTYAFALSTIDAQHHPNVKRLSGLRIALYIIGGLLGLTIGGRLVVDNASMIAKQLSVSEKLIGLTIVSIGTSLPELFTSAIAAAKGKSDIAIGNIVGSNIFNIFFILGISSIIKPLAFQSALNFDIFILIIASLLLFFMMFTGKRRILERWEAIIFIFIYITYIVLLIMKG